MSPKFKMNLHLHENQVLVEPQYQLCTDTFIFKVIKSDINTNLTKKKKLTDAVADLGIILMETGTQVRKVEILPHQSIA